MTFLLAILGGLRKLLSAALGVITRHPWQCACIALLAFSVLLYRQSEHNRAKWIDEHTGRLADRDSYRKAQNDAKALAIAEKARIEQRYKDNAHAADTANTKAQADALAAADRYIRLHRPAAGGPSCAATATAGDNGSGVPAGVSADSVVVASDDVRACSGAVAYALEARAFVLGLEGVR